MNKKVKQEISELLKDTAHKHHQAFIDSDGADPEWALWYADQLKESLPALLGVPITRSRIIYELIRLDDTATTGEEEWSEVYAAELLKKYSQ